MIDFSALQDWESFTGEDDEDTRLCHELLKRAESYLATFRWCAEIREHYVGLCVGGVVAVLLFRIEPVDADEWIWVVVGDLPSAYIAVDGNNRPSRALSGYISEMRKWTSAARAGEGVHDLIPVNVPANPANASRLDRRLDYLEREVLPDYD